nr:hypothetical protein [Nostoc sp. DedSLP05]MDZ8100886.1 hypothetical protein [Nostoc sp. DedSLP01]
MSECTPWTFHRDRSNSYFNYATPNFLILQNPVWKAMSAISEA